LTQVLVDTGILLRLMDRADPHHLAADRAASARYDEFEDIQVRRLGE
jgi:predicted nucleic acid-binding protein